MDFTNKYIKLSGLWLGLAVLIYLLLWLIFAAADINDFPAFLHITVSVLGAGLVIYKYFYDRVF